jgi:hypothetical protein
MIPIMKNLPDSLDNSSKTPNPLWHITLNITGKCERFTASSFPVDVFVIRNLVTVL